MFTDHLHQLQHQHQALIRLVEAHPAKALHWNVEPGKWSVHEHIAHLARYQEIFQDRMKRLLREDEPHLGRYRAEDDPQFEMWRIKPIEQILQGLLVKRTELLRDLQTLSTPAWSKRGAHPKFGLLTLSEWLHFFLLHENHHIYTVFRILKEFRRIYGV